MSDFDDRPTITIQELLQRWGDWLVEREGPGDVDAGWARLSSEYEDWRRKKDMETVEAVGIVFASVTVFGLLAVAAGWVMVRGWRSRR